MKSSLWGRLAGGFTQVDSASAGFDASPFGVGVGDTREFLTTVVDVEAASGFSTAPLDRIVALRAGWDFQHLDTSAGTTGRLSAAPGHGLHHGEGRARPPQHPPGRGVHMEFTPLESHAWAAFARHDLDLAGNGQDQLLRAGVRRSF